MSFLFGEVYALSQLMTDATGRVLFQGIHEEHEESLGEEHRRGSRHSGRGGHRRKNQKENCVSLTQIQIRSAWAI